MNTSKHPNIPKLVYFSPEPDREGHASYTHVHEIINNLRDIGWSIDYYSPRYATNKLPGTLRRLCGISYALLQAICRRRPDVLYIRWHFAAFPLSLWAHLCKVPVVVEVNGPVNDLYIAWPVTRKFSWLFRWLMQAQLKWAASIVPVTDGLAVLCRDMTSHDKPIQVIPNGANVEHFHPDAINRPVSCDNLPGSFCVFFGTMAPWQGIDNLLTAIDDPSWPVDFPLLIAGDGERRTATEEMAAKYPDKLRYLGRLPYNDLPALVARSKFSFVCTQNLDGRANSGMAPLKLFESLACSVPVIATRMPFQENVVEEPGAGILVDEGHPEQILEAVKSLLSAPDQAREMGKKGRAFVELHHSWRARAIETHKVLINLSIPKG